MKTYCELSFSSIILDLGEDEKVSGQLRASPGEQPPRIQYTRGWVGPRACLDVMEKKEISCLWRESKPDFSVIQPVA
jgi:hypothetical protein